MITPNRSPPCWPGRGGQTLCRRCLWRGPGGRQRSGHCQGAGLDGVATCGRGVDQPCRPQQPLLARAVAAAQAKGMFVVAAVGNDGAASPLSYPASYKDVVAVTGVDGKGACCSRPGGQAIWIMPPPADMSAIGLDGRAHTLRAPVLPRRSSPRVWPLIRARGASGRAGPRGGGAGRTDRARDCLQPLPQGHLKNPEGVRENRSSHRFLIISQSPRSFAKAGADEGDR
jgi:hypothetical protein